ncbi:MAG: hypothetical protein IKN38_06805 [Clostridia bacterium]|nr:hypothetical protein [Clostridia bacterium]
MEHLKQEDLIRFAKLDRHDADAAGFAGAVHRHIMECRTCAAAVRKACEYFDAVEMLSLDDFSLRDLAFSPVQAERETEEQTYRIVRE